MVEEADLKEDDVDRCAEEEALLVEDEETVQGEAAEPADELATLRQCLEEEEAKAAEYLDGWQRARAELANARKRWERESAQTYNNALADSIARLLPVVDDFERAVETLPDDLNGHPWIDGTLLIYRKLWTILEQQGVVSIEVEPGMSFDPAYHQAVTHEPHDAYKAGEIIAEFQKGYKLNDRIVRPASVRVSSGPPLTGSAGLETTE